jgi:hypothetical protein
MTSAHVVATRMVEAEGSPGPVGKTWDKVGGGGGVRPQGAFMLGKGLSLKGRMVKRLAGVLPDDVPRGV